MQVNQSQDLPVNNSLTHDDLGVERPNTPTATTTRTPLNILNVAVGGDEQLAAQLGQQFALTLLREGGEGTKNATLALAQALETSTNLTSSQAEFFATQVSEAFTKGDPLKLSFDKGVDTAQGTYLKSSDYRDWVNDKGVYVVPDECIMLNPQHYVMVLKAWWDESELEMSPPDPSLFEAGRELEYEELRYIEDSKPSVFATLPRFACETYLNPDGSCDLEASKWSFRSCTCPTESNMSSIDVELEILTDSRKFIPEIPTLQRCYDKVLSNFEKIIEMRDRYREEFNGEISAENEFFIPYKYDSWQELTDGLDIKEEIREELRKVKNSHEYPYNTKDIQERFGNWDESDTHELRREYVRWLEYNLEDNPSLDILWRELRRSAIDFMRVYKSYEDMGAIEKLNKS
jgi:hypothetical protein